MAALIKSYSFVLKGATSLQGLWALGSTAMFVMLEMYTFLHRVELHTIFVFGDESELEHKKWVRGLVFLAQPRVSWSLVTLLQILVSTILGISSTAGSRFIGFMYFCTAFVLRSEVYRAADIVLETGAITFATRLIGVPITILLGYTTSEALVNIMHSLFRIGSPLLDHQNSCLLLAFLFAIYALFLIVFGTEYHIPVDPTPDPLPLNGQNRANPYARSETPPAFRRSFLLQTPQIIETNAQIIDTNAQTIGQLEQHKAIEMAPVRRTFPPYPSQSAQEYAGMAPVQRTFGRYPTQHAEEHAVMAPVHHIFGRFSTQYAEEFAGQDQYEDFQGWTKAAALEIARRDQQAGTQEQERRSASAV